MTAQAGPRAAVLPLGLLAAAGALALAVQAVFDPFTQHIPLCPVRAATGLLCPGCGAIRSVHALLAGDPVLALRNNALVTTAIPLVGIGLVAWAVRRSRGLRTNLMPSNTVLLVLVGIAVLYAVLRNLPMFWFLAPISYVGG